MIKNFSLIPSKHFSSILKVSKNKNKKLTYKSRKFPKKITFLKDKVNKKKSKKIQFDEIKITDPTNIEISENLKSINDESNKSENLFFDKKLYESFSSYVEEIKQTQGRNVLSDGCIDRFEWGNGDNDEIINFRHIKSLFEIYLDPINKIIQI